MAGDLAKGGLLQFPNGKYTFERLENVLRGNLTRDRKLLLLGRLVTLCATLVKLCE